MDDDDAADVPMDAPPLPEQPQLPSRFDLAMTSLESDALEIFDLSNTIDTRERVEDRLTIPQATRLVEALKKSTSVQVFHARLQCCSVQAIPFFIDYIRTSARLKDVTVDYNRRPAMDHKEIVSSYIAQVDQTLIAVGANPSIHKLTVCSTGSPNGIYNLLANTTSLKEFQLDLRNNITENMAMSIAAGMGKNASLGRVELMSTCSLLATMLSGLAVSSSVEALIVRFSGSPTTNCWESISKMIHFSTSIQDLELDADTHPGTGEVVDKVLSDLRHPACTGLKTLRLKNLAIGGTTTHDVPIEQAVNTSLQVLRVEGVFFQSAQAVRNLWNVVSLHEIFIDSPVNVYLCQDETASYLENWAKFIRRNDKMTTLDVIMGEDDERSSFLNGVLDGARNHKSLAKLKITGSMMVGPTEVAGNIGARLSRVLKDTQILTKLHFERLDFKQVCATLLAQGLCGNTSVDVVSFKTCDFKALSIVEIVESLFVNQTLKDIAFQDVDMEADEFLGGAFCKTLGQLFQINKGLVRFMVPKIDLRAGALADLFFGLRGNKSLKKLLLDECSLIDNEAMASLGDAFEATDIYLEELGLPKDGEILDVPNVTEGTRAFLQSLVRMPNMKKIHFGDTIRDLDDEFRGLLLVAAEENKNLVVLDGCAPTMQNSSSGKAEIEYYLKLNRFGRRLLQSTNLLTISLWPSILSQMTSQPDDADALFYFVREYFSRQWGLRDEEEPTHPQSPPKKKARLTDRA